MAKQSSPKKLSTIVVGAGSVGVRFVQELFHENPSVNIKIFGGEGKKPYKREDLSKLLSGKIDEKDLYTGTNLPDSKHIKSYFNNPVTSIDLKNSLVIDSNGEKHPYKNLVIAVGSFPLVPNIKGLDLKNVIVFRNLADTEALLCRQVTSRSTLVIGGGQVGLDTANAMKRHNTKITVIEHRKRLMFNQLDNHSSIYLRLYLDDLGMDVRVETIVEEIKADKKEKKVSHVILDDGEKIECDTVVVSIGVKPNIELAKQAGLKTSRGILIDDYLQTNHPGVYAIGECAEHRGRLYGVAQPGYEQAKILAKNLSDRKKREYLGSTTTTEFKVIGYPFLTIGDISELPEDRKEIMYRNIKRMIYRKLILKNGCLHGVIAAGRWREEKKLKQAVKNKQRIWPWQRNNFEETGNIWKS